MSVDRRLLFANRSVDGEGSWNGVRNVVPGSVETHCVVVAAGGDAAVVTHVGDRNVCAALRFVAIPDLGDFLTVCKGEGQRPVGNGGGSRVVDGDGCPKAARPLTGDGVNDVAGEAGLGRHGERDRCRGGQATGGAGDGYGCVAHGGRAAGGEREDTSSRSWVGAESGSDARRQAGRGEGRTTGESVFRGQRDGGCAGRSLGDAERCGRRGKRKAGRGIYRQHHGACCRCIVCGIRRRECRSQCLRSSSQHCSRSG